MPDDVKRLNINLPRESYDELQSLAKNSHRSMTDVVRTALGLVKVAMEEERRSNSISVVNSRGETIKQLVLPK